MPCHLVSLWIWPAILKVIFIEIILGMYNLERRLRYSLLLTRYWPCNLLPGSTYNLGQSSHIWSLIEVVFNSLTFSKCHLRSQNLLTGSNTRSRVCQEESRYHFRLFEYLIDAISEILTAIWHFKFGLFGHLMTSSMTSWIGIYMTIITIPWYICTASLMISLFVY